MRTFRCLDVSRTRFNRFKNNKNKQLILNMKNAILVDYINVRLVICRTSVHLPWKWKQTIASFLLQNKFVSFVSFHCVKSVRIRSYFGTYFLEFGLNT